MSVLVNYWRSPRFKPNCICFEATTKSSTSELNASGWHRAVRFKRPASPVLGGRMHGVPGAQLAEPPNAACPAPPPPVAPATAFGAPNGQLTTIFITPKVAPAAPEIVTSPLVAGSAV